MKEPHARVRGVSACGADRVRRRPSGRSGQRVAGHRGRFWPSKAWTGGPRQPALEGQERVLGAIRAASEAPGDVPAPVRLALFMQRAPKLLHCHLEHGGHVADGAHYPSSLLGWMETGGLQ